MVDQKLLDYATDVEAKYLKAVEEHGGYKPAARALGRDKQTVKGACKRAEARAAKQGYAPKYDMTKEAAPGFLVKGTSTYYNAEGKPTNQWVKTSIDNSKQVEMLREAIESVVQEYKGAVPTVPYTPPALLNRKRMVLFPLGDPHFGMHAWSEEAGENFDLETAEVNLVEATQQLVEVSPETESCMIANLGDYYHADNSLSRTERSGNALDVDTRYAKVVRVGFRAKCYLIELCLQKFKKVYVKNLPGNHDPHSALWHSLAVDAMFSNNTRVEVDLSPAKHVVHQFGKVMLAFHHGDTTKIPDLPLFMAARWPEIWGNTKYRHWHCGHVHHINQKEYPGVVVETHRTLAGKDAWHAGVGYISGRHMQAIVYDEEYGEVLRHTVGVEMLQK